MTLVRCEVKGVFMAITENATIPLVVLTDGAGRCLPIFIGIWEAVSINSARNHEIFPRPFTHDLFLDLCGKYSIMLRYLQIDSIQDGIYYAQLILVRDNREEYLDCRPSDGISLALRGDVPIFVEEVVLASSAQKEEELTNIIDLGTFFQK